MDRYTVTHGTTSQIERWGGLDLLTARRLVEHEQAAGRRAHMELEKGYVRGKGTYR